MRVYTAEPVRGARRRRRWVRVLLWTFAVLLIAAAAVVGAAYFYLQDAFTTIARPHSAAESQAVSALDATVRPPGAKQPAIALMLGYDARFGDRTSRSDTLILMRLDPKRKILTMLSFSRDLVVEIPGHGIGPINQAYAFGGAALSIATVQQLTGLKINYLIPVNFRGFIRTVDAFDGAYVEIDQRYHHVTSGSNNPNDPNNWASIDLRPGYQHLNGHQALDFVRFRHYDSDIVRNARQQAFVREFRHKIDIYNTFTKVYDLVNILKDNVRVFGNARHPLGEQQFLNYVNALSHIPKGNFIQIRPDVTQDPANPAHVVATPAAISKAVAEFADPNPRLASEVAERDSPAAKPKAKRKPAFVPAREPVEVRNGNGIVGAADHATTALVAAGWKRAHTAGNADRQDYFTTRVYYGTHPGSKEAAKALAALFGDGTTAPLTAAVRTGLDATGFPAAADVVVVVGSTWNTNSDLAPTPQQALPPKQAAAVTADPTRDLPQWQAAQRQARIPLEMPTKLPSYAHTGEPESSDNPFYVYSLGNGRRAVHVTYYTDKQRGVFGVQALRWKNPPILAGVTQSRTVRGTTYYLYYNGASLHRVAWRANGITYWLSNSLIDYLSNATMLQVATSFRPVPRR
jgi:LCP family protein required for cell wall assembly